MSITRTAIIAALQEQFERIPEVGAMWLEGADAAGRVDEYSDIDVCCAVQAGFIPLVEAEARAALVRLGALDLATLLQDEPAQRHIVLHLQDSSPYLLIDLCLYVGCGSDFTEGDEIEKPLVLFDRAGAIRYHPQAERLGDLRRDERLHALQEIVAQASRIDKYLARGEFLEAFGYYEKFLLAPLIEVLCMRYTPLHADYGIVHISRHLPADVRLLVERLYQVGSLADLTDRVQEAEAYFAEAVTRIDEPVA
jgi:tetratricopeptide (TPR) repeat protein